MTLLLVFFLAATPATLDQIRADRVPEHRAKAAIDYALIQERSLEAANDDGDNKRMADDIENMTAAVELARDSFTAAGKTPGRQPGSFKNAELRTHEMLIRLDDFRRRADPNVLSALEKSIMRIQEIHDAWFNGIMGRKK